ncbi:MAG: VOC family protein [Myxococcales bacterium]
MANPFIHIELHTQDPQAAKKFYAQLLDWKLNDMDIPGFGSYTLLDVGGGTGGGIMKAMSPQIPPHWLAYIDVKDLDASVQKAQKLGAKVLQPKTDIPGFGVFAVIQDPTGAAVGLYQAAAR